MTAVLLATYNGARWLEEQLASLFAQTTQDFTVVASDDGSTDTTVEILSRWASQHPGRLTFTVQPRNLGYKENFRWLLKTVEAGAYFLCDQDDVWHPEKVSLSLGALGQVTPGRPALVYSDLSVVDGDLSVLHPSLWRLQRTGPAAAADLRRLLVTNVVTGCTTVLNRAARDLVVDLSFEPAHDHALALHVLRAGGLLTALDQPLVSYRQHGTNTIGARSFGGALGRRLGALAGGEGRLMADRAVEWGVFRTRIGFYLFKALWWVQRWLGPRPSRSRVVATPWSSQGT